MTEPIKVLFVCTANICRSPRLELRARALTGGEIEVSSAGTHGFGNQAMSEEMTPGLDAETTHRRFILDKQPGAFRKVLTVGQFAGAVRTDDSRMTGRALVQRLGTRRGTADPSLDVPDPYRLGPDVAAACARTIENLLRVVVPALNGSRMIAP